MKPKVTVVRDDDEGVFCTVSKAGRLVSHDVLLRALAKRFPGVVGWTITEGSHASGAWVSRAAFKAAQKPEKKPTPKPKLCRICEPLPCDCDIDPFEEF